MSHAKQTTTVIAGEASESDDDYSTGTPTWSDAGNVGPEPVPQGIQQGTSQITNTPAGTGIVVSGEASESDDENDKNTTAPYPVMTVTDEDHSLISAELPTRPTMNLPAYDRRNKCNYTWPPARRLPETVRVSREKHSWCEPATCQLTVAHSGDLAHNASVDK
jgi:hypothetical protein